ncbi:MAG: IS607 family element transposase accessory protein TnpB [Acidobacteriota bacterium]|nr:IS607 family element transposase accessory protein TnpB [Acidobacteriota bacterium]
MSGSLSPKIHQAYRYAIDPTPEQVAQLRSHVGGARFAYNALLGLVKANWDENQARKEAGEEVAKADYLGTSQLDLQKLWYAKRDELAPWWDANASSTYNYAHVHLARAFTNWKKRTAKFPTPRSRRTNHSSTLAGSAVRLVDSHHVRISRVGEVKTYESTRKLFRHLERGTGRILAATISERRGKWWVSFTVEVERQLPTTRPPERIIGVDVGLTTLYTGATPTGGHLLSVANPRNLVRAQDRLARAQRVASRRQGPRKGVAPSKRWQKAQQRVQRVHARVGDQRRNLIHETTTMLAKSYDLIVIEDLNVKGMLKNHTLAKHISDAAWGEFVRQLDYKTAWYGSALVRADRFYPSSKTCSRCGAVKAKLGLDEREYHCEMCDLTVDRDLNAATNLARLASSPVAAGTSSVAGRGGEVRPGRWSIDEPAHPDEASTEALTLVGA